MRDLQPSPLPTARLPRVLREFFATEAAGGIVLVLATAVALVWVNSPWSDSYDRFWTTELSVHLGSFALEDDLRHWVNDGLMAVFFFVVGVEIKRELVAGELHSWRRAATPAIAAVGGMLVPAIVYLAITRTGGGIAGWGIPMATDIAFALGVAALLGPRVSTGAKLFLLTLAIVDDIGAIVVIAIFYSEGVELTAIAVAAGLLLAMAVLRWLGVRWMPAFVVLGVGVWLAVRGSGVHATIAGVILGLCAPARPLTAAGVVKEWAEALSDEPTPAETQQMTILARNTSSMAERLELMLHPYTSFVVVPIFAVANAGIVFRSSVLSAPGATGVAVGVAAGLVVGKLVGVVAGARAAVRLGVGDLPDDVARADLFGIGALAGIGFTVSLFITELAFADESPFAGASKLGILAGSIAASLLGAGFFLARRRAT